MHNECSQKLFLSHELLLKRIKDMSGVHVWTRIENRQFSYKSYYMWRAYLKATNRLSKVRLKAHPLNKNKRGLLIIHFINHTCGVHINESSHAIIIIKWVLPTQYLSCIFMQMVSYLFRYGNKSVLFGNKWRIGAPGIVNNNTKIIDFKWRFS